MKGKLHDAIFVGATTRYLVNAESGGSVISTEPYGELSVGEEVILSWESEKEFLVK